MLSTNRHQIQSFKIYCNSRKKNLLVIKEKSKWITKQDSNQEYKPQVWICKNIFLKTNTYKQVSLIILLVLLFYLEPLQQNFFRRIQVSRNNRKSWQCEHS